MFKIDYLRNKKKEKENKKLKNKFLEKIRTQLKQFLVEESIYIIYIYIFFFYRRGTT